MIFVRSCPTVSKYRHSKMPESAGRLRLVLLDCCLSCCKTCDRNTERRAADVVETDLVEEVN